jgi:hypothetical protein
MFVHNCQIVIPQQLNKDRHGCTFTFLDDGRTCMIECPMCNKQWLSRIRHTQQGEARISMPKEIQDVQPR